MGKDLSLLHPACGKFISENEKTRFYEPSISFKCHEFDDYAVVMAVPKDGTRMAMLLLKSNVPIWSCKDGPEGMYWKLLALKNK